MPIDTHQTYRRLLEASFDEQQADVQARIFADWTEERLVTRDYLDHRLEALEARQTAELKAQLSDQEQRLVTKISEREQRIVTNLTGRMFAVGGLMTAILGTLIAVLKYLG